jgi:hypothetical protein
MSTSTPIRYAHPIRSAHIETITINSRGWAYHPTMASITEIARTATSMVTMVTT